MNYAKKLLMQMSVCSICSKQIKSELHFCHENEHKKKLKKDLKFYKTEFKKREKILSEKYGGFWPLMG